MNHGNLNAIIARADHPWWSLRRVFHFTRGSECNWSFLRIIQGISSGQIAAAFANVDADRPLERDNDSFFSDKYPSVYAWVWERNKKTMEWVLKNFVWSKRVSGVWASVLKFICIGIRIFTDDSPHYPHDEDETRSKNLSLHYPKSVRKWMGFQFWPEVCFCARERVWNQRERVLADERNAFKLEPRWLLWSLTLVHLLSKW